MPAGWKKLRPICLLTCSGINLLTSSGEAPDNSCLKLKRGGNGRPFGRRALGSRSSSRKDVHMLLELCSEDLVSIAEVEKQDRLLQEAFVCERPCAKGVLLSVET